MKHQHGDPGFLYIFVHMPKAAGTSFISTVAYNLPREQRLIITPTPDCPYQHQNDVDEMIASLSERRRDSIRFIAGHAVYFGIHKHFRREPRYITIMRNPVTQAISNYLHIRRNFSFFLAEGTQLLPPSVDAFTFDWWWRHGQRNIQAATLLNYRVEGQAGWDPRTRIDSEHVDQARQILSRFYFVGLQESFEEDALYLYSLLGVTRLMKSPQNVASNREDAAEIPEEKELAEGLAVDMALYETALGLNAAFKDDTQAFSAAVSSMRDRVTEGTPIKYRIITAIERLLGQKRAVRVLEAAKGMLTRFLGRDRV